MKNEATAQQIINISNKIWESHGWNSLEDVNQRQFKKEFLSKLSGKTISENTLSKLEDENYHNEIKVLRASGNRQSKKDKYESCVQQVKKQDNVNPYAVCTASVGRPHTTHSRRSGRSRRSM